MRLGKALMARAGREGRAALRGVVLDMDGTLTRDGAIDFRAMRAAAGVPDGSDILAHVAGLKGERRTAALSAIDAEERRGIARMELNDGCAHLLAALRAAGLKLAILTRNSDHAVTQFLDTFALRGVFDHVVSRDTLEAGRPKPAPDAVRYLCAAWALAPSQVMMVGDWVDDITAGVEAGALTALLKLDKNRHDWHRPTHAVDSLDHLLELIASHYDTPKALPRLT
mmetsp:Transcript_11977/g.32234  ORF Transcript_11977/g.32234 Transcript_11977/m.32234 type:complete len:226 (+) Transcript_11977:321-998(+)